ncbi:shikimate dehydrogenase [Bifidobacterium xylocopae]|uniref:Shikimate dehydrogenase n=2 Tax=Bifidobacterium xylocopae TaxID=2493119 RepID=A0A366KC64_9BIFI|nr:shikimate dehydrogenase [Bifidobacterium xylocopae]
MHCAVLGSPITHSLSPLLHQAAYRALGLAAWTYRRAEVGAGGLPAFLSSLDASWVGLSLTMPLKREVMGMGCACDPWSVRLGIANTAILDWHGPGPSTCGGGRKRPRLALYNTDVEGIVCALAEGLSAHGDSSAFDPRPLIDGFAAGSTMTRHFSGFPGAGTAAVVIGSGATACSALAAYHCMGIHGVTIVARDTARAAKAVDLARSLDFERVEAVDMEHGADIMEDAGLVVSTLPAYAADSLADSIAALQPVETSTGPRRVLLDVAYDPRPSRLVRVWRARRGGVALGGERMLLYQAVRQVALMTGTPVDRIPIRDMNEAMRGVIG